MKKQRISVSLPPDMMAHYKELAKASGISVSRLIYLRLKNNKPIIIVGRDVLESVTELKKLVEKISSGFYPNEEIFQAIIQQTNFFSSLVEIDNSKVEKVQGGR